MIRPDDKGPPVEENHPDAPAVLAAHDQFWQSYARRDLEGRFAVCADDATFFGTGRHEQARSKTEYRAMNEKGAEQYPWPFSINPLWTRVRVVGDVAWTECDADFAFNHDGDHLHMLLRQTTVLQRRDGRWLVVHVHASEPDHRLHEGEFMTIPLMVARNKELEGQVAERTRMLNTEIQRSDELLLNILPAAVAQELKDKGRTEAKMYNNVSVLFTDFMDFTRAGERLTPAELVAELNECFTAFDRMLTGHGIEKIKTIGDAYMAVAGLPNPNADHAADTVQLALEIQAFMRERQARPGQGGFGIRLGIHSGTVVAGIVGVKKFQYDIWGDTVNTAARMEQYSLPGTINISTATHALVKDRYRCTPRGNVMVKGKGPMEMYIVEGRR
jgi:uncharacterized protein (TIGR02246 family)